MSTSQPIPIRAVTGFSALSDGNLAAQAAAVGKQMSGNPAFTTPPVDLNAFNSKVSAFTAAIATALDGSKTAKAARDKQRKLVIQDLRALSIYVENNCKDDKEVFLSSGFQARTGTGAQGTQPVQTPAIRKVDYGHLSGQLLAYLKAVPGGRSYNLRYAQLTGTTPGPWTTLIVPTVKKAIVIGNLTPGMTYAFEVQAVGPDGVSDWSDSSTCMCT